MLKKGYRKFQICVIGNSEANESLYQAAYNIGHLCGKLGATVVTGGGFGVMEAAAKGAIEAGGETIGILRETDFSKANKYLNNVIASGLGHTRNSLNILAADLVIGISGGAGTLSEYAFAWIENKPIIAFTGHGGWSDKIADTKMDHRDKPKVIGINDFKSLKTEILKQAEKLDFSKFS